MTKLDCGHKYQSHGTDENGKKYCYNCCAKLDKDNMRKNGRITLYFTKKGIENWPGTLNFQPTKVRTSRHNFGLTRTDAWFIFEGRVWHGFTIGDMTELFHARQTKQLA